MCFQVDEKKIEKGTNYFLLITGVGCTSGSSFSSDDHLSLRDLVEKTQRSLYHNYHFINRENDLLHMLMCDCEGVED